MYKPPKGADVQGTTKYTGKRWDAQIAQADRDQKVMGVNKGTRELTFVETMDGDPTAQDGRLAGGPAALPRKGR